jgi:ribosome-associated translation inhibitor RaiA
MIRLEIDGDGYELNEVLRAQAAERIGGLDEFMSVLAEGHVKFSWEGGPGAVTKVTAQVRGKGCQFDASDTDRKPIVAIDKTRAKLEAQIRTAHGKQVNHRPRQRP